MESLTVPKRKVRVRVRPVTGGVLDGEFYVSLKTASGRPERVSDRLNDSSEKYLPLALEDRHVLLSKACLVSVEVGRGEEDADPQVFRDLRRLRLELGLTDGSRLRGSVYAWMEPAHSRALDYLNAPRPRFISLFEDDRVVLVNGDYVAVVSELFDRP
ncbi:MAG: hypothetical protein ACE5JH_02565 [Acidobacteriota bacterium]